MTTKQTYRIEATTNSFIAKGDPIFNGRTMIVLKNRLTLKEAQRSLLELYNEKKETSYSNWGLAVIHSHLAACTHSDGTRQFEDDSRFYKILPNLDDYEESM